MQTHGPNEAAVARQAIMNGQPLPDFIVNAPELLTGLDFYLNAFYELNTERPGGMGILPIPISKMREWGRWNSLDKDETDDLIYLIKELDKFYMGKVQKDIKAKTKGNGKSS